MKNLLLPLLITLSTTILAKTPDSLFGISINDNILNYVTKEELKSKGKDALEGYFYILLKNPPVSNEDYVDYLFVMFDKNNKIGNIQSQKSFQKLETCKLIELPIRNLLMDKFNIEFEPYPNIQYGFYNNKYGVTIATECNVENDNKTTLIISLESQEYLNKRAAFLNSQI